MATFVLVHGAWGGSWVWHSVAPGLRARGHQVVTPTLTGLGERAHLLSSLITLDTHVGDIVNALFFEDLAGVVLVGHSYGGMPVTVAAERAGERISRLVYLDALIPEDGECAFDLLPPEAAPSRRAAAQAVGAGISFPPPVESPIPAGALRDWAEARLRPHPLGTYETRVRLQRPAGEGFAVDYLALTEPANKGIEVSRARARAKAGWRYEAWEVPHDAPLTHPAQLVDWLEARAE